MKKMWLLALVLAFMTTLVTTAQARGGSGVLFDVNLYYSSSKIETKDIGGAASVTTDGATAIYDVKLGYLSSSGLYLGGIYTSRSNSVLNQSGTSGSATGGSVGYMGSAGFFIMGHYLVSATDGNYKEGSGVQADFGYKAGISNGWLVGAELSYRSMTYKKNDGNTSLESYKKDEVIPMVSVGYIF